MNNHDGGPPKTRMPCDPGWNDPPTLSYNTQTASKPRNLLNKRVAFPLNAENQTTPVVPIVSSNYPTFPQVYNPALPPLIVNPTNILLNPANTTSNQANSALNSENITVNSANTAVTSGCASMNTGNGAVESDTLLNEVNSIMNELLEINSELGPKAIDIKKRLQTMEEMWKDNKLCYTIQVKMQQLANALKFNKLEQAENIQKALMVDHVSSVSSWMVGIRQLIHYCQAKEELMKIDQSEER